MSDTPLALDGLVTGLNTSDIINQLMSVERQPLLRLQARQADYDARVTAWNDISSSLAGLRTSILDILSPTKFNLFSATSSDTSRLTATAGTSATAGTTTFRVNTLAAAHQLMSQAFASSTQLVGAGTFTVGEGLAAMGITNVAANSLMTDGTHTLKVISASSTPTAATVDGSSITGPFTINGGNKALNITVNGSARTVNIANGTYNTVADLATAVQTAIGAGVTVTANGSALRIQTTATGSTSSLQITGGNALATLGLSVQGSPTTGTDTSAVIELDGVQTTVNNPTSGQQVTVNGTTGSMTLTLGTLAVGSGSVHVAQTTASTTLTDLASKLDASGMSAQLINTGTGANPYELVLTSSATGTDHALTVNTGGLTAFTQAFSTLRAASDATLTMGSLTITRDSNTISDFIQGVTLNLVKADPTTDVTVSVGRDNDAVDKKVKAFVDALNKTMTLMRKDTAPGDPEKGTKGGALSGESGIDRLQTSVANAMWYTGTGAFTALSQIGITLQRDGTYALDESKLKDSLSTNFDGVVDLMAQDTAAGTQGVMGSILSVVDAARATNGLVDSSIQGDQSASDEYGQRIADERYRITGIEARYRSQFASLEALIGQLHNQSAWLAGQISSLR